MDSKHAISVRHSSRVYVSRCFCVRGLQNRIPISCYYMASKYRDSATTSYTATSSYIATSLYSAVGDFMETSLKDMVTAVAERHSCRVVGMSGTWTCSCYLSSSVYSTEESCMCLGGS